VSGTTYTQSASSSLIIALALGSVQISRVYLGVGGGAGYLPSASIMGGLGAVCLGVFLWSDRLFLEARGQIDLLGGADRFAYVPLLGQLGFTY
jgi:hypothetical protein